MGTTFGLRFAIGDSFAPGDVIVLMPPLTVTVAELQHLAASLHEVIVERFGA